MSVAKHSRLPAKQRGVALVTAILLVAIATGLATKLAWDNQLNLRRTESTLIQEQAKQIALAAEAVLAIELRDDPDWTIDQRLQPDQCFDNFGWAAPATLVFRCRLPPEVDERDSVYHCCTNILRLYLLLRHDRPKRMSRRIPPIVSK